MSKVVVVSVVRDFDLYNRLVVNNRFLTADGVETVAFDNRRENIPIPRRYNAFLDARSSDEDVWYIFCHEDFEFMQSVSRVLDSLDRRVVYGTVGADDAWRVVGNLLNCRRDGACRTLNEVRVMSPCRVSTVDCCCLIVHASLVASYRLRFDDELAWDFYTEDFSILAAERHRIATWVVPILCRHWSYGVAGVRFRDRLAYMRRKWCAANGVYVTTTMECLGNSRKAIVKRLFKSISTWLWYRRFVGRNEVKISCLRVGVRTFRVPRQKIRRFAEHV